MVRVRARAIVLGIVLDIILDDVLSIVYVTARARLVRSKLVDGVI